jgi:hypothetical protein
LLQFQDENVRVGQALKIGLHSLGKSERVISSQQQAIVSGEDDSPQKKPAAGISRGGPGFDLTFII